MKKKIYLFLCIGLIFSSLVGCGKQEIEEVQEEKRTTGEMFLDVSTTNKNNNKNANTNTNSMKTVFPIDKKIDVSALEDGIYFISFNSSKLEEENDGYFTDITFFTPDVYDKEEMEKLKIGDSISVNKELVKITNIENTKDSIIINDGLGNSDTGCDFYFDENYGGYRYFGYDDFSTYTEKGVRYMKIFKDTKFIDSSDYTRLELGPIETDCSDLINYIKNSPVKEFHEHNTMVNIENNRIVEIVRLYNP